MHTHHQGQQSERISHDIELERLLRMLPTEALVREISARRNNAEMSFASAGPSQSIHQTQAKVLPRVASLQDPREAIDYIAAHINQPAGAEVSSFTPRGLPLSVLAPPPGLGTLQVEPRTELAAAMGVKGLSSATFRPPPGLPVPLALPCHGSALHSFGQCEACVPYAVNGMCPDGRECKRCHLCSPHASQSCQAAVRGALAQQTIWREIPVVREDAPVVPSGNTERNGSHQSQQPRQQQAEQRPETIAGVWELPHNPGSALHASSQCEPCAWFWKPQGCRNGDACRRCHLCPPGEVAARRKAKVAGLRAAKQKQVAA